MEAVKIGDNSMKKFDKFLHKHLANIALVITFTILINEIAILGAYAGLKIRWFVVMVCDLLLICDWIHLIRCWTKENQREVSHGNKMDSH